MEGYAATAHPAFVEELGGSLQDKNIYAESRVVVDKQIVTSRGPGTSLEWALCLVEQLYGRGTRQIYIPPAYHLRHHLHHVSFKKKKKTFQSSVFLRLSTIDLPIEKIYRCEIQQREYSMCCARGRATLRYGVEHAKKIAGPMVVQPANARLRTSLEWRLDETPMTE